MHWTARSRPLSRKPGSDRRCALAYVCARPDSAASRLSRVKGFARIGRSFQHGPADRRNRRSQREKGSIAPQEPLRPHRTASPFQDTHQRSLHRTRLPRYARAPWRYRQRPRRCRAPARPAHPPASWRQADRLRRSISSWTSLPRYNLRATYTAIMTVRHPASSW